MKILLFEFTFRKWLLLRYFLLSLCITAFLYFRYVPYENLAYDYLMIFGYLLFSYSVFQGSRKIVEAFSGPFRFFYLGSVSAKSRVFFQFLMIALIEFWLVYLPLLLFQCLAFSSLVRQNLLQISPVAVYGYGLLSLFQSTVLFLVLISLIFFLSLHTRFFSFDEAGIWSGFIQYLSLGVFLVLIHLFTMNRFPMADVFSPVSLFNFSAIDGALLIISCGFLFYWISSIVTNKLDFY